MLRIFVSSVIKGLQKERRVAEKAIRDLILNPDQFEIFPAFPGAPREICLQKVGECDIFILILKDTISEIVLEEFQTAEQEQKEILIFLKKDPNNRNLKRFLRGIEGDYTYKPFNTLKEFEVALKESIQHLLVHTYRTLKDVDIEEKSTVTLTDDTIVVEAFVKWWLEYELDEGDVIKGIVREASGERFNVYFLNEKSFSDYLNDREFVYVGDEDVKSFSLDEYIDEDGSYYLTFDTNAVLFDRTVRVKIRRVRYA